MAEEPGSSEPKLGPDPSSEPEIPGEMLTIEQVLMRAIVESPDDDLPRLAYADWCEENGNITRANLVRFQVKFPKIGGYSSHYEEEKKLLEPFQKTFKEKYPGVDHVMFSRGFAKLIVPESLKIAQFIEQGPEMFEENPLLDAIAIDLSHQNRIQELCDCPSMVNIHSLDVKGLPPENIRRMLNGKYFTHLKELSLNVGNEDLRTILSDPKIVEIEGLALYAYNRSEIIRILINSSNLSNLKQLDISGVVGDATQEEIRNLQDHFADKVKITY